jgi:hypothetical protein
MWSRYNPDWMHALALALPLLLANVFAQTQPAPPAARIENSGKPMRLSCQCSADDIRVLGLTCPNERPCPVYLELTAVEGVANRIVAVGNLHTDVATLSSVLLGSDDAGKTWYEPFERLRSAGLDQVEFLDFESGWISGQTLGTLPRNPFLLITRDGGKTWRARPVWSDPRVGTIEAFHFDSRSHGRLWIDRTRAGETENRYEEYETETGGESWMIRQVSDRPIRRKTPVAGDSLRLRPDAAAKSFRIERQSGERWSPVASFLVLAGECREPEITVPEPEPEPEPQPVAPVPSSRPGLPPK